MHPILKLRDSWHSRLCTNKTLLTINGQFPGPTLYARKGDLVIVDVVNRAAHNITIHWHGVKMPRYPWSDGPEYVTQCPISPGTRFSQRVVLSDEEGTLWWHAHSEWSRATVYGALVILQQRNQTYPFPKPQAEVPLILGIICTFKNIKRKEYIIIIFFYFKIILGKWENNYMMVFILYSIRFIICVVCRFLTLFPKKLSYLMIYLINV